MGWNLKGHSASYLVDESFGDDWKCVSLSPASAGDANSIPESGRSLQKEMGTPSSTLAWEIPRTEGLHPLGLQSIGRDLVTGPPTSMKKSQMRITACHITQIFSACIHSSLKSNHHCHFENIFVHAVIIVPRNTDRIHIVRGKVLNNSLPSTKLEIYVWLLVGFLVPEQCPARDRGSMKLFELSSIIWEQFCVKKKKKIWN